MREISRFLRLVFLTLENAQCPPIAGNVHVSSAHSKCVGIRNHNGVGPTVGSDRYRPIFQVADFHH